jgi:hypothetical protein
MMVIKGVDWIYLDEDRIQWLSSSEQRKELSGSVQSREINDELTYGSYLYLKIIIIK